jgi:hypothetical protein
MSMSVRLVRHVALINRRGMRIGYLWESRKERGYLEEHNVSG